MSGPGHPVPPRPGGLPGSRVPVRVAAGAWSAALLADQDVYGMRLLVLLGVAVHAAGGGCATFGVPALAQELGVGPVTVSSHLRWALARGWLVAERARGYELALPPAGGGR